MASEFAVSSQNSKVGGSSGQQQTVTGLILAKKKLQYFSEPCQAAPDNPEILGNEMLPNEVFREELAAISAQHCLWQLCDTHRYSANQ